MIKKILTILIVLLIAGPAGFWFLTNQTQEQESTQEQISEVANIPIIDINTHATFDPNQEGSLDAAIKKISEQSLSVITIISPPPFKENMHDVYDSENLVRFSNDNIKISGGGGSLNILIQKYSGFNPISEEIKNEFRAEAEKIVASGAVAFGEIAALHIALGEGHPFEETTPNHPLFLLLSDLSAKYNLPILLHLEAADNDQTVPPKLKSISSNPSSIQGNISEFEELLDHNRQAKIIWLQAGWDHTGNRTIELMSELLDQHPNLYLGLKTGTDSSPDNSPLGKNGELKNDWKNFLIKYEDRAVIASDNFFSTTPAQQSESENRQEGSKKIIDSLPQTTAEKIAYKNALEIFGLEQNW